MIWARASRPGKDAGEERARPTPALLHDALHRWRVAKATVGGKRRTQAASPAARGHCPHPRAQGALSLSLDRERDLERRESEKERARAGRVMRPPLPCAGAIWHDDAQHQMKELIVSLVNT